MTLTKYIFIPTTLNDVLGLNWPLHQPVIASVHNRLLPRIFTIYDGRPKLSCHVIKEHLSIYVASYQECVKILSE